MTVRDGILYLDDRLPLLGSETPRRLSQRERVLRMLQQNPVVTNHDFCAVYIPNFNQRITELKRQGWRISAAERIDASLYGYRLLESEPRKVNP